jgi:glycosyltransferase involved in cell wall biosynthesis
MVISEESTPLVSVVLPTRNRLSFLKSAIESAKNQTHSRIEIIIIDDASTDDTAAFLKGLNDQQVTIIRNESPKGGGAARNQGIERAVGAFVAFLDDDDTWMPEKLEKQLGAYFKNDGCSMVTCSYYDHRPGKSKRLIKLNTIKNKIDLFKGNFLGGASMFLTTKSNLNYCGGFDEALRSGQDWDLLIRLAEIGEIAIVDEPLVNYYSHEAERISNQIASSYGGLRNVYFKYLKFLPVGIKRQLLSELLFYRWKMTEKRSRLTFNRLIAAGSNIPYPGNCIFYLRFLRYVFLKK